jgi:hypothetical protein
MAAAGAPPDGCWSTLPHDILIRCLALAASRSTPLPALLAPSRVCRAWAGAYRDDALWRNLFEALWQESRQAANQARLSAALSWRERLAAHALALPLLNGGGAAGATELPLEALFDGGVRTRRESILAPVGVGGHVCALAAGRLTVAHLGEPHGSNLTTTILHSVRASLCASRFEQDCMRMPSQHTPHAMC